MAEWWRRFLPGSLYSQSSLERKRTEVLSGLNQDRLDVELMAKRQRRKGDSVDNALVEDARERFMALESRITKATSTDELDDLLADSEVISEAQAYLCPVDEISDEGSRAIDNLELWGIPTASIQKLRDRFKERLAKPSATPQESRGALHSILIEVREWSDYIDEYEDTMRTNIIRLFYWSLVLDVGAGCCLYFSFRIYPLLWLALLFSGASGSMVSVMARMPAFDASLSGELSAYGRRIRSRIVAGATGSVIGCALLAWGVLPIAIKEQTFAKALETCVKPPTLPDTAISALLVIGVSMLLGFSERTLTSFEQRVFGESKTQK